MTIASRILHVACPRRRFGHERVWFGGWKARLAGCGRSPFGQSVEQQMSSNKDDYPRRFLVCYELRLIRMLQSKVQIWKKDRLVV